MKEVGGGGGGGGGRKGGRGMMNADGLRAVSERGIKNQATQNRMH